MTNREMFEQIKGKLTDAEEIAFIETQIAALDRKAEKARERAAAKKAEGDELREKIYEVLSTETMTIPQIIAAVGIEDLTPAKVTARLRQLVELEKVAKEKVKTETGDKMGYYIPTDAIAE